MNAIEEFNRLLNEGYNSKSMSDIKHKLEQYLTICHEKERDNCRRELELSKRLLEERLDIDRAHEQYCIFKDFLDNHDNSGLVELEYIEPFGNSYGIYIKVDRYVMELVYKHEDEINRREVRTKFFLDTNSLYKQFMIKRDAILTEYNNLHCRRRDYYPTSVTSGNWGNFIINVVKLVEKDPSKFVRMCQVSCPFNNDGTHKYKSWRTKAKVEVTYEAKTGVVQGFKNGSSPWGGHVVGGNGSFRYYDKGDYVLKITVDSLACECPIRYDVYVDIDKYIRDLKDEKGWGRNMPYKKVDSVLGGKIDVITHDMSNEPKDRAFFPIEYDGNWIDYLKEKLEGIE